MASVATFSPCSVLAVLGAAGLHSNLDTAKCIIQMHSLLPILLGSFLPITTNECKLLVDYSKE